MADEFTLQALDLGAIAQALIAGRLDPTEISVPCQNSETPALDVLEQQLFDDTGCRAGAQRALRVARGMFRLVRHLANDQVPLMVTLLRAAEALCPPGVVFRRLLEADLNVQREQRPDRQRLRVEAAADEVIAECAEIVGEQLLMGGLEPLEVPLPTRSIDSSWLDALERDVFAEAVAVDEIERAELRREWGAWRLVRRLANDDATSVRLRCERVVVGPKPLNSRLRRLMEALRSYAPIVPAHASRSLH